jgi:hypothetical protein
MNACTFLAFAAAAGCGGTAFVPPDAAGVDAVAPQDASPDSASDALVVTNDDGGIFACGSAATCDGRHQVCEHVEGGVPPGVDFYECIPIPAACDRCPPSVSPTLPRDSFLQPFRTSSVRLGFSKRCLDHHDHSDQAARVMHPRGPIASVARVGGQGPRSLATLAS